MRTHIDSIIDVYSLNEENKQKEKILENILAKISVINQSIINELGKRTSTSSLKIYIPRKEFKDFSIQEIEDSILLIHRTRVNKIDTNEWYQVTSPKAFEANNNTITFEAERIIGSTDTNNHNSWNVL